MSPVQLLFTPLVAWFLNLVGKEALAEIQRKKAAKAKAARAARAAAKAKDAAERAIREAEEERRRKWRDLLARARSRYPDPDVGPPENLDPNPYGDPDDV